MKWRRFDLASPPACSGIYAIRHGRRWLYIGMSTNIAKRIQQPRHPALITRSLPGLSYHYLPMEADLRRTEKRLHESLKPEWNGGTSWENPRHVIPMGPHCIIDDGWGAYRTQEMEAAALKLLD